MGGKVEGAGQHRHLQDRKQKHGVGNLGVYAELANIVPTTEIDRVFESKLDRVRLFLGVTASLVFSEQNSHSSAQSESETGLHVAAGEATATTRCVAPSSRDFFPTLFLQVLGTSIDLQFVDPV